MAQLTNGERIILGTYNGRAMGLSLKEYNKIVVLSQVGIQCVATASSLIATFLEKTEGVAKYYPLKPDTVDEVVEKVIAEEPQAVVIIVGGAERLEECRKLLRKVLEEFAKRTLKADIVLSIRGYLAGCIRDLVRADVSIMSYMELLKYLRYWSILTHDVDFDRKSLVLGRLRIEKEEVIFEKVAEYPLLAEHLELLEKLIRG